jgi:hypothetical protein
MPCHQTDFPTMVPRQPAHRSDPLVPVLTLRIPGARPVHTRYAPMNEEVVGTLTDTCCNGSRVRSSPRMSIIDIFRLFPDPPEDGQFKRQMLPGNALSIISDIIPKHLSWLPQATTHFDFAPTCTYPASTQTLSAPAPPTPCSRHVASSDDWATKSAPLRLGGDWVKRSAPHPACGRLGRNFPAQGRRLATMVCSVCLLT